MPLSLPYPACPHGMHYCLGLHLVSDGIWYSKPCLKPALQCQGQHIWQKTMSKPWLSTASLPGWTGPQCPSGLWLLSHHCRESASKIQTQPPFLPDSKPWWNLKGVRRILVWRFCFLSPSGSSCQLCILELWETLADILTCWKGYRLSHWGQICWREWAGASQPTWTNACCFPLSQHNLATHSCSGLNWPLPDKTSLPITVKAPKENQEGRWG